MNNYPQGLAAEDIKRLVGIGPLMLEIGSHEGADTETFLEAMPLITLYCFEPDQRPIARFKELIGDDSRVVLTEAAVGDVDGHLPFYASAGEAGGRDDWDFSGSLCRATGHLAYSPTIKFKEPEAVPCVCLDSWMDANLPPGAIIDFAWVDIQGAQHQFLRGAAGTLPSIRYLYIEAHNAPQGRLYEGETTQEELIALLPEFEPLGVYQRDNILFRNRTI